MANIQNEEKWLKSTVIPELLKNGKLPKDFKLNAVQINLIGTDEAFMLTICYKAKLDYEAAGESKSITLVVKRTPNLPGEEIKKLGFPTLFHNEIYAYKNIFPAFSQRFGPFDLPEFFYSELESEAATVILSNFNDLGFTMCKDTFNLSLEHILLAVKYLGRFHALGFALKSVDNACFQELVKELREPRYGKSEPPRDYHLQMKYGVQRLLNSTRKYQPEVDEQFLQKLEQLIWPLYKYFRPRVQPLEPLSTICHGDYLRNNIAFKYDKTTGKPVDVIMFDLQTMRYSSPMIDLGVLLSLSSFAEVRHKHFNEIFEAYCDSLAAAYVKHAKRELPAYLSKQSLLKNYIQHIPYALGIASFFLILIVEPLVGVDMAALDMMERSEEAIKEETNKRGGEMVDREFAAQIKELYELTKKYNIDLREGLDFSEM